MILTIAEIAEELEAVEETFRRESWQFAKKISDEWVMMIHLTDAIETGDYLRAVNWHTGQESDGLQEFTVDVSDDPEVFYEGFVEGGTNRMAARYPAKSGIERTDFADSIESFISAGFSRAG